MDTGRILEINIKDYDSMNNFKGYKKKNKLFIFSDEDRGTYYTDSETNVKKIIHYFNNTISAKYTEVYVKIFQEVKNWISKRPSLDKLIIVEQPLETGEDYLIVPFHRDHLVLCVLDEFPEVVDKMEHMQQIVKSELGSPQNEKEKCIEQVVNNSLLSELAYTIFDETIDKFIIIEPVVDNQILEEYSKLI